MILKINSLLNNNTDLIINPIQKTMRIPIISTAQTRSLQTSQTYNQIMHLLKVLEMKTIPFITLNSLILIRI